jgi:sortase (surface protein transpeptidase)
MNHKTVFILSTMIVLCLIITLSFLFKQKSQNTTLIINISSSSSQIISSSSTTPDDNAGYLITENIKKLGIDSGFISTKVIEELDQKSPIDKKDTKTEEKFNEPKLLSSIIKVPEKCEKKNWLSFPKFEVEANLQNQSFDEFFEKDSDDKIDFKKPIQEKQADINSGNYESIPIQKLLKTGIVHIPITPQPGEVGNSYIVGHTSNFASVKSNYNTIFKPFESKSEVDDEFYIFDHRCRKLKFKVFEVKAIKSADIKEAYKNFGDRRVVTLQGSILEYVNGYLEPTKRWLTRGELIIE